MQHTTLQIHREQKGASVSRYLYGHFSEHLGRCIYDGLYVGEDSPIPNTNGIRNDVLEALKAIGTPVLRWPGGCFADEYHWKDGIGKPEERPHRINTFWGYVTETNRFGTHEFLDLCEKIGCAPYIAGNLGSGSVQEMSQWLEYMTFDGDSEMADLRRKNGREKPWDIPFFGIGNENWGGGGNMRPEYYADEYRRYQTFCRSYSGTPLCKVACGPNANDYNWTDKLLESVKHWHTSAISLHYYTVPTGNWEHKGSATDFSDAEYYDTIAGALWMNELITEHKRIMDKHDPDGKIKLIVDEWGCWYDVEPDTNPAFLHQQNTMRDAIVAACTLHIFHDHADRVMMANLAQMVNVLQSVILTNGADMVKTPTYHVFRMFLPHHDSVQIAAELENFTTGNADRPIPALSCSVTEGKDGGLFVTIANCSLEEDCCISINADDVQECHIITAPPRACNAFGKEETVTLQEYDGCYSAIGRTELTVPKCSVVSVKFK